MNATAGRPRPPVWCQWLFAVASVLALAFMGVLTWIGAPMDKSEFGILCFEFAGTTARTSAIFHEWGDEGKAAATLQTWWDFGFIAAYSTALASGAWVVCYRRWPGVVTAGMASAAGSLDVVENVALLQQLAGATAETWPRVAFWCAAFKFGLAGLAFVSVVGFGVAELARRLRLARGSTDTRPD